MGSYVLDLSRSTGRRSRSSAARARNLGELSRIDGVRVPAGLLRDDRRLPAGHGRRRRRSTTGSTGCRACDPDDREAIRDAQRRDPPDHRSDRHPRRPGGGDHRRARPARRARRLRRPLQRDGGGPADGVVRRPAGHVPERRRAGGDPRARQPVLGLAVHRAGRDLPPAQRHRPPHGPAWPWSCSRWSSPSAAGVLFTADPVTSATARSPPWRPASASARRWSPAWSNPDVYKVRDGEIVARTIATKQLAVRARRPAGRGRRRSSRTAGAAGADRRAGRAARASSAGGSRRTSAARRTSSGAWPTTTSRSSRAGRSPRCSRSRRPTTTSNHVYVSVGHQQMMTDAMKPLGLSLWQLTRPAADARGRRAAVRRRHPAPGRRRRAAPASWTSSGRSDPLIGDALQTVLDRGDFVPPLPDDGARRRRRPAAAPAPIETDPAIVTELIERSRGVHRRAAARHPRRSPGRRCSTSSWPTSRS